MKLSTKSRAIAAALAIALATGIGSTTLAGAQTEEAPTLTPSEESAGTQGHLAAPTFLSGGTYTGKKVVTDTNPHVTSSGVLIPLPGASLTFSIPPGQSRLFNARFTAESLCTEAEVATSWCTAAVFINGVEAAPAAGFDFAFDSTERGTASPLGNSYREGNAIERHRRLTNTSAVALPVTVQVRYGVANGGPVGGAVPVFTLDDYSLAVEVLT